MIKVSARMHVSKRALTTCKQMWVLTSYPKSVSTRWSIYYLIKIYMCLYVWICMSVMTGTIAHTCRTDVICRFRECGTIMCRDVQIFHRERLSQHKTTISLEVKRNKKQNMIIVILFIFLQLELKISHATEQLGNHNVDKQKHSFSRNIWKGPEHQSENNYWEKTERKNRKNMRLNMVI